VADIRILILPEGLRQFEDTFTGIYTWTESAHSSPNVEKWKQSSTFWPKRLLSGEPQPMEVFFCLNEEVLTEGFESPRLHRLVRQAHRAMWGANVYFVIEKAWQPVRLDPEQPEPYYWIEDLVKHKVADILEWSVKSNSNYTEAARRSRERMDKLAGHRTHRAWKCLFQDTQALTTEEERLLAPYLIKSPAELAGDNNCLIVFRFQRPGYLTQLQQMVAEVDADELMIGLVDRFPAPLELEQFCRKENHEFVRFHGIAELYYFLQKLNQPLLGISLVTDARLLGKEGTPVRVVDSRFKPHHQQLLITHSYLKTEPDSCFTAATDTWELINDLPDNVQVEIYPAIDSVKLANIVGRLGPLLAWIHIGHGDSQQGLQQSDELFRTASDWINSFTDYKSSLPLVLFSSCYSEPVAQKFAEAGVGVAIGFSEAVNKRVCVELTKRVVDAALEFNGERTAILLAFLDGHDVLKTADSKAVPLAFWSRN
jgi:hypothetical protein